MSDVRAVGCLVLALVTGFATGCSHGGDSSPVAISGSASGPVSVRSVNLRLSDLPPGWVVAPGSHSVGIDQRATRDVASCLKTRVPEPLERTVSPYFVVAGPAGAQERVASTATRFADPADVAAWRAAGQRAEFPGCFLTAVRTNAVGGDPVRSVSVHRFTLDGRAGTDVRLVEAHSPAAIIDEATVVVGEIAVSVQTAAFGDPFPAAERDALLRVLVSRASQLLASRGRSA